MISSLIHRWALNFIIKFLCPSFFYFFPSFIDLWLDNTAFKTSTFSFFNLRILLWLSEKRHTLVYLAYFCFVFPNWGRYSFLFVLRSLFWVGFYLVRTLRCFLLDGVYKSLLIEAVPWSSWSCGGNMYTPSSWIL